MLPLNWNLGLTIIECIVLLCKTIERAYLYITIKKQIYYLDYIVGTPQDRKLEYMFGMEGVLVYHFAIIYWLRVEVGFWPSLMIRIIACFMNWETWWWRIEFFGELSWNVWLAFWILRDVTWWCRQSNIVDVFLCSSCVRKLSNILFIP